MKRLQTGQIKFPYELHEAENVNANILLRFFQQSLSVLLLLVFCERLTENPCYFSLSCKP